MSVVERPGGLDERGQAWMDVYLTAWPAQDLDALLEPVHPDAFVFYPLMVEPVDREGLRAFFEWALSLLPDFTIRALTWAQSGDDILIEWAGSATVGGEPYEWRGTDRFRFDADGRIVDARAYWDPRELLEKIAAASGSPPPVPPAGDGA